MRRQQLSDVPKLGIDTTAVATWLGVKLTPVPNGYRGVCPLHADASPSFYIYVREGRDEGFYCFGCGRGGTAAHLLVFALDVTLAEAYTALLGAQPDALTWQFEMPAAEVSQLDMLFVTINTLLGELRGRLNNTCWIEFAKATDAAHSANDLSALNNIYYALGKTIQTELITPCAT